MPEWVTYSEHWQVWEETLADGRVMRAYKHAADYEYRSDFAAMPAGWVLVHPSESKEHFNTHLEKHHLAQGAGWLEINCTMHEVRIRHGGAQRTSALTDR